MLQRLGYALAIAVLLASNAAAQVVRFETTAGEFDMVLNPTNNPQLQGNVDNLLNYVESERYHCAVLNRAVSGFVLQMGSFKVRTADVPQTVNGFLPIVTDAPVQGVPAATVGLSNTVGTVAFALPGDGMGGTNQDGGTSSFFVNLTTNAFLDPNFTVFAQIPDMTTINAIMALPTVDLTQDPNFGVGPGNLTFTDVPLRPNGSLVLIMRAFVVTDTLAMAAARAGLSSPIAPTPLPLISSPARTAGTRNVPDASPLQSAPDPPLAATSVPEPSTYVLILLGVCGIRWIVRRART